MIPILHQCIPSSYILQSAKPLKSSIDVPYRQMNPQNPTEPKARGTIRIAPAIVPKQYVRARACGSLSQYSPELILAFFNSLSVLRSVRARTYGLPLNKVQYSHPLITTKQPLIQPALEAFQWGCGFMFRCHEDSFLNNSMWEEWLPLLSSIFRQCLDQSW